MFSPKVSLSQRPNFFGSDLNIKNLKDITHLLSKKSDEFALTQDHFCSDNDEKTDSKSLPVLGGVGVLIGKKEDIKKVIKTDDLKTETEEYDKNNKLIRKVITVISADNLSEKREIFNSEEKLTEVMIIIKDKDKKSETILEHSFEPNGLKGRFGTTIFSTYLAGSSLVGSKPVEPVIERRTTKLFGDKSTTITIVESFTHNNKLLYKSTTSEDGNETTYTSFNSDNKISYSRTEGKTETVTRDYGKDGTCKSIKIVPKDNGPSTEIFYTKYKNYYVVVKSDKNGIDSKISEATIFLSSTSDLNNKNNFSLLLSEELSLAVSDIQVASIIEKLYEQNPNAVKIFNKTPEGNLKKINLNISNDDLRKVLKSATGIEAKKTELEEKYGVQFYFESWNFSRTSFKHQDIEQLLKSLQILEIEFKKYPPGFLKSKNIKINLVQDLKSDGHLVNGLYTRGNIYLEGVESFDHELYHFLDDANGGIWGLSANNDKWNNENGNKGFGWHYQPKKDGDLPPGFVKQYGRVNTNEDQATVAESLLSRGNKSQILLSKSRGDIILAEKAEKVKAEYSKWSNGLMDKEFFQRIAEGSVIDEEYWNEKIHTSKDNPKEISLDPNKPINVVFKNDVIWLKFNKPYSVYYIEMNSNGDIDWNKKLDCSGNPTNSPLFTSNDGLFMWGLNYDKKKNGAVLLCDPNNGQRVLGKLVFWHQ